MNRARETERETQTEREREREKEREREREREIEFMISHLVARGFNSGQKDHLKYSNGNGQVKVDEVTLRP